MQIGILGPLEVRDDGGQPVEVAGTRLRTVLSRLAVDAGRPVSVTVLVDAVWGDRPPADENNALQTLVSRLRRALGDAGAIVQSGAGYRLAVHADDVDANCFERLAAEGSAALRRGEPAQAARLLREALALWRGPALADAAEAGDALVAQSTRLDDLRLAALIDRAEAVLDTADPATEVAHLETLVGEHPLHERLTGLLMRALGASGRQADALHAYERLRVRLADELGVDPSAELQEVHLSLLRGEVAQARAAPPRRTNLKAQLTSFVGRDDEVARIGKSLEQNRLVTLVGPGGAGKTRLASEAVARIVDTAPDGIWLAELAAVTSGSDVPQAVLGSLGLREMHLMERRNQPSARDAMTRLREGLADKRAVLVLDNCEHVIEASARLAEHLLSECADLRVLTTSREPLGILGEVLLAVPPLGQPAPTATAFESMEYPAVRLFADRAAAVQPDFAVEDASVATVIEIVRRLDGLPLAIELAAARLRTLPLDDIAHRLSDRFRLLTGGNRTALPRHRTLRAVVEWSWDLLTPTERLLVEQLAVFPSGVTVGSAVAVCSDSVPADDVADVLASLIDKSLLQPVGDGRRVRMLETIREYGAERLAERGELGDARSRHAEHFAAVMAEAEPYLTTREQLPWFDLLRVERENLLAAMRFRCESGDADGALQLAVSFGGYAMMLGDHAEIGSWMADALAVPGGQDSQLRIIGQALLAINSTASGVTTTEMTDGLTSLRDVAVRLADVDTSSTPMMSLLRPAVAFFGGDEELAQRYIDEAIAGDNEWARAAGRMFKSSIAENSGDVETMRVETEIALADFRRLGERWGTASSLRGLAQLLTLDGDLDRATAAYEEAMELMAEMQSSEDEVLLYGRLADLALRRGDLDSARGYAEQAELSADENGTPIESVFTLAMFGELERRVGNSARAEEIQKDAMERLDLMPREHPAHGHIRAIVVAGTARLAFDRGDLVTAARYGREAYEAAVATRDLPIVAAVGVLLAHFVASSDRPDLAAEMLGAAARLRGAEDLTALDVVEVRQRLLDLLGAESFQRAYDRGRALAREEAIARLDPTEVDL